MFELTFGQFSVARKPIINGGAIRPLVLNAISDAGLIEEYLLWHIRLYMGTYRTIRLNIDI